MSTLDEAINLIRLGVDAATGKPDPIAIAKQVVRLGLAFVPEDDLRAYLTEEAIARAEKLADLAEALKFGGEP
jgi:hypothetical protein